MKTPTVQQLVRCIAIYYFLVCFLVCLMVEVKEVKGKTNLKTKLLLQNIRTHMAQKIDEIVKKKECEEGLTLCKTLKSKDQEAEEERSEEIPPPPKILRGQHKPTIKVNPKDVIQTLLPKVHKSPHRKLIRTEETQKRTKISSPGKPSEKKGEERTEKKTVDKKEKLVSQKLSKVFIEEKESEELDTKLLKRTQSRLGTETKEKGQAKTIASDGDKKSVKKELEGSRKREIEKKKVKKEDEERKVDKTLQEESIVFLSSSFIFALEPDTSENDLCLKQSQVYVKNLKKFKTWALMMYDASAKLPSGIFQGNINQYGDFDECLSIHAVFKRHKNKSKELPAIRGKYCLASADLESTAESEGFRKGLERVKSFEFIRSNVHDPGHFIPRFSTVNWGICVPSSCLAEDVERFLKSHLRSFNESLGLLFEVKVEEENCVVKDDLDIQLQAGTAIAISVYLAVFLAALYATCIEVASKKREKNPQIGTGSQELKGPAEDAQDKPENILMAFSISKNLRKLFQGNENKKCIECINGIKSICTVVLYFAHKTLPLGMTPFCNRIFLTKVSNEPLSVFMRTSMVYTDSFLLISGVLTSYNLTREISEKRKVSWARKSLDRFIRLTPASVAVLLFYAYVWHHLGSGPTWNSVVKKNSELCQKYLWRNLLFVQNFFPFEDMCAPQTHQLALDLQLSMLAPLFVHLLHTYGKVGAGILQALFLFSSIMRYLTTANNELSVIIYHGMHVSQLYKTANLLYTQALHRASPYVLGTIVGYYLQQYEKRLNMSKLVVVLGWSAALFFAYYSVISPYNSASRDYQYNVQEAAQYAALSPVAWSIALSWIITACHLGCGGKLNQFLCQKVFLVFSRISYSIYLTQFLVFFYNVSVKKVPDVFTVAGSLNIAEFFAVIFFSTLVTLFFDIPTVEIKRIILDKKSKGLELSEGSGRISEKIKGSEQELEINEEHGLGQEWEEMKEEGLEEEGEYMEEVKYEDENLQSEMVRETTERDNDEEEDVEDEDEEEEEVDEGDTDEDMEGEEETEEGNVEEGEAKEGDDEEDENMTTTFQLRLPKFSARLVDDAEDDAKDWLILEPKQN